MCNCFTMLLEQIFCRLSEAATHLQPDTWISIYNPHQFLVITSDRPVLRRYALECTSQERSSFYIECDFRVFRIGSICIVCLPSCPKFSSVFMVCFKKTTDNSVYLEVVWLIDQYYNYNNLHILPYKYTYVVCSTGWRLHM